MDLSAGLVVLEEREMMIGEMLTKF